jgi:hypothetical protein
MAGTAAIYRIDANTETESTAATANEIVEFNTGATNPDARSHLKTTRLHYVEDISIHPNPNRHLSQIQDGKLGTQVITITGQFVTPASAGGIAKFMNWMKQDKTNSALKFGRFGVRFDNISQLDQTPSTTIGYILQEFWVEDVEEYQDKADFYAVLYRDGAV